MNMDFGLLRKLMLGNDPVFRETMKTDKSGLGVGLNREPMSSSFMVGPENHDAYRDYIMDRQALGRLADLNPNWGSMDMDRVSDNAMMPKEHRQTRAEYMKRKGHRYSSETGKLFDMMQRGY